MTCLCTECLCKIPVESGRKKCRLCRRNYHRTQLR